MIDTSDPQSPPNIRDAFLGQNYPVLPDEPGTQPPADVVAMQEENRIIRTERGHARPGPGPGGAAAAGRTARLHVRPLPPPRRTTRPRAVASTT